MTEDLLTIKEIARRLDLPESNIRYYRDRFEDFLPYVGQGRKRRYRPQALQVFSFIVESLNENMTSEEIGRRLARKYPRGVLQQANGITESSSEGLQVQGENPLSLLMFSQSKVLERLSEAFCAQSAREAELRGLRADQDRLRRGLALLWKSHKVNREDMNPGAADPEAVSKELRRLQALAEEMNRENGSRLECLEERMDLLEQRILALHGVLERVADALSLQVDSVRDMPPEQGRPEEQGRQG